MELFLLPPPPCVFFFDEYRTDRELIKYYGVLKNRRAIGNYRWYKTWRYHYLPVLIEPKNAIRFLRDMREDPAWAARCRVMTEGKLIELTKQRIYDWETLASVNVGTGEISEEAFKIKRQNIDLFTRMIKEINVYGGKVVIVIPPFTDIFMSRIADSFIKNEYEKVLNEIAEETGSGILNFCRDQRFFSRYELFCNVDCLNEKGAEIFTKIVLEKLGDMYGANS